MKRQLLRALQRLAWEQGDLATLAERGFRVERIDFDRAAKPR